MKLVVFGAGNFASLAWYVLKHDSPHEVVGFTVNAEWQRASTHHDLPLVPFETLEQYFPPEEYALIIPLGWIGCNRVRAARYAEAKVRGYSFVSYVSSRAIVWPDLDVGENSMIYEGAVIQPFAKIGTSCIVRCGSYVSHHAVVGDNVFIAGHGVVAGNARIGDRCFLGLNSTIRDGVTLAPGCVVAAGALVTADTEPDGLYIGVPARRRPLPVDLS